MKTELAIYAVLISMFFLIAFSEITVPLRIMLCGLVYLLLNFLYGIFRFCENGMNIEDPV